jgi:hypothetical protein
MGIEVKENPKARVKRGSMGLSDELYAATAASLPVLHKRELDFAVPFAS